MTDTEVRVRLHRTRARHAETLSALWALESRIQNALAEMGERPDDEWPAQAIRDMLAQKATLRRTEAEVLAELDMHETAEQAATIRPRVTP